MLKYKKDRKDHIINLLDWFDRKKKLIRIDIDSKTIKCDIAQISGYFIEFYITRFYSNINVPFKLFQQKEWDINKVMYDNLDSLFYNPKYMSNSDVKKFQEVFLSYVNMIESNFQEQNLFKFFKKLVKMPDHEVSAWMKEMVDIMSKKDPYYMFSPQYIFSKYIDLYSQLHKPGDSESITVNLCIKKIKEYLRDEAKKVDSILIEFKETYQALLDKYFFEFPIYSGVTDITTKPGDYQLLLLNSALKKIISTAERLISLNVYSINELISDITDRCLPLNKISVYDSKTYANRELVIL